LLVAPEVVIPADPLLIVAREPGALQPFHPLPGRQAETGLKRRGGEAVADAGRAGAAVIWCGTTPALNAATAVNTSGRRCAAAIAQAPPLAKPAAAQGPPAAPTWLAAQGMTSPVTQ
jgi:hypothetical protein